MIKKLALEQREVKKNVRTQTSLWARDLLDKRSLLPSPKYSWDYVYYIDDKKCEYINANYKIYYNKLILRFLELIRSIYKGVQFKTLTEMARSKSENFVSLYTEYYYTLVMGNKFLKDNNIILPDGVRQELDRLLK